MEEPIDADTNALLEQVAVGDSSATQQLFARHRERLERMVAIRMDRRMASRIDPADVVQDTMLLALRRIDKYLENRPLPFYVWLRHMAWERLIQLHRKHVLTEKRAAEREVFPSPDQSAIYLADRLIAGDTSPSGRFSRKENKARVRVALLELPEQDREILVLLYLEQLSTADIAAVLEINPPAVRQRHARALQRLHRLVRE